MRGRALFLASVAVVCWPSALLGALIVNPQREITHRVTVQMIQTALSDGSSPATVFGNATQRASIEAAVDTVWAQAGIDVFFLPTINRWNNTFAYQGNGGPRNSNELGTIVSSGDAAGVTNSTPSVINEFFVNVVPAFSFTSENSANGIANLGRDGTAQFVGDSLLTFLGGREVIASVVAHEIGHVLGLKHTPDGGSNLMSPGGATEQLSDAQISAIFQTSSRNDTVALIPSGGTGFLQFLPLMLAGDYNDNGVVDAADYTIWRNTLGSRTNLAADGDRDRVIDMGDFLIWKNNFGSEGGAGAGAILSQAIPEPSAVALFVMAALMVANRRSHWRGKRQGFMGDGALKA